jgi:hypothetical protein
MTKVFKGLDVSKNPLIISQQNSPVLENIRVDNPIGALNNNIGMEKQHSLGFGNSIVAIHQLMKHGYVLTNDSIFWLVNGIWSYGWPYEDWKSIPKIDLGLGLTGGSDSIFILIYESGSPYYCYIKEYAHDLDLIATYRGPANIWLGNLKYDSDNDRIYFTINSGDDVGLWYLESGLESATQVNSDAVSYTILDIYSSKIYTATSNKIQRRDLSGNLEINNDRHATDQVSSITGAVAAPSNNRLLLIGKHDVGDGEEVDCTYNLDSLTKTISAPYLIVSDPDAHRHADLVFNSDETILYSCAIDQGGEGEYSGINKFIKGTYWTDESEMLGGTSGDGEGEFNFDVDNCYGGLCKSGDYFFCFDYNNQIIRIDPDVWFS